MYDTSLPTASKKRKSKKKATSEVAEEEASEPKPKKVKKEKAALQEVGYAMPTIQEEVLDLEPMKVLNKRTRGGTSTESSLSMFRQPTIHKKKRKVSDYVIEEDDQIEAATDLVPSLKS